MKETSEFYKNSNYKDGLEYRCKECRKQAYPTARRTADTQRQRAKYGYPIYTRERMNCLLKERTKEILEMLEKQIKTFYELQPITQQDVRFIWPLEVAVMTLKDKYGL